jgi:membrane-associated phospholipid phosphatase
MYLPLTPYISNLFRFIGYELRHGLTPAHYSMLGSPGGLARIDALFGTRGYTATFTASPMVFGAFPSLHAGAATMEALFLSHFFPKRRWIYWVYCGWLFWSTMYLTRSLLCSLLPSNAGH